MGAPNTLIRTSEGPGVCRWDGQRRRRVFTYSSDGSGGHTFCNVECFGAYHDVTRADYDYIEFKESA